MRLRSLTLLLPCAMCACSSSTSSSAGPAGTAAISGTFTFMPARISASAVASQADANHVRIMVTSVRGADACSTAQMLTGTGVASAFQVVVTLDFESTVAPGTYALGNGWQASYRISDPLCVSTGEGVATKGNLEIDAVDTSIHGIADMTFHDGRVIAEFDAPFCSGSVVPSVAGGSCAHVPSCPEGQGADLNPTPTETCNEIP